MKICVISLFLLGLASFVSGREDKARELSSQVVAFAEKYKDEVRVYYEAGGRLTDEFDPFFSMLLYECELLVPENKKDFRSISLEDRLLSIRLIRSRSSIILMAAASVLGDSNDYVETNTLLADWSGVFVALNEYEMSIINRSTNH